MTNPTPHGQATEALRLAEALGHSVSPWTGERIMFAEAAAELRRLHAYCQELEAQVIRDCMTHVQNPPSSAVLKAIREANMQLVRTGDDAFMLVPYKVATAQAAESVPAGPRRKDMLWSTAKMQERHDQRIENIVSGLERIKQEHAGQQPQKIDECYGDCPTDSTTCTNPCRFDGRAARDPAESVLEDAARWRDWSQAFAEASAAPEDTVFMKAFEDAIGDSDAPFTAEQFTSWVDAARKQGANHD